jgi:hypothetical protein
MKEKEKSRLKKEGLKLQTRRRHVCGSETIREILLRKFFTRKFVSRKLFPEYFAAQVGVGWEREISVFRRGNSNDAKTLKRVWNENRAALNAHVHMRMCDNFRMQNYRCITCFNLSNGPKMSLRRAAWLAHHDS